MNVYPGVNIRFPETMETKLIEAMKAQCVPPWSWQATNPLGKQPNPGSIYFHRDKSENDVGCTLCIHLESNGNYVGSQIVSDGMAEIPHSTHVRIIREFDSLIAEPAAESIGGITSVDVSVQTLEDHFSAEEVKLLERFCLSSNAGDGGSNLSDQEKWMDFLICVHRKETDVSCDVFGECLVPKNWWPEHRIARLVSQYDFGIRLLCQYDKMRRMHH